MARSPQDALNAYLHTLHLSHKVDSKGEENPIRKHGSKRPIVREPQGMELISALAAGNGAKLMVEIASFQGITPLTMALAVAAKQTGADSFAFFLGSCTNQLHSDGIHDDLQDVIELRAGDACDLIKQLNKIDFAVIDCKLDLRLKSLLERLNLNARRSVLVASNILQPTRHDLTFAEAVKKSGAESPCPWEEEWRLLESDPTRSSLIKENTRDSLSLLNEHETF